MTRRIFKYAVPFSISGVTHVRLPPCPVFLACAFQGETLVVWAEVPVVRSEMGDQIRVALVCTGDESPSDPGFSYLGTALRQSDGIVLHVYVLGQVKH